MDLELKYPQWQKPLKAAILEVDYRVLEQKIQMAEMAISSRMMQFESIGVSEDELCALAEAFSAIRVMKKDLQGFHPQCICIDVLQKETPGRLDREPQIEMTLT
jgi:hypothetical protein